MSRTLTILLNRGPFSSEYADMALKMALKARGKGYNVNMWLHIDGVWATHLRRDKPGENTGKRLKQALEKGVKVKICIRCAEARDLLAKEIIEGMPIVGLPDLFEWLKNSDKVLTFTG